MKTQERLEIINQNIGHLTIDVVAELAETSVGNVYKLCHRHGIKIPRGDTYIKKPKLTEGNAIALLKSKGYRVIPPDPFRGN